MIEACLFDVGNTLTNASVLMAATLEDLARSLKERGIVKDKRLFIDVYNKFNKALHRPHWSHAFGEAESFRRTLEALGIREIRPEDVLNEYRELFEGRTCPDLDVIEAFKSLRERGIKVGLISNDRSAYVEMFVRRTEIENFLDVVVVSEEVGVEKPDPGIFEEARRRLGVEFSSTVIFGDNEVADGGGRRLGMKFVLVKAHKDSDWAWDEGKAVEPDCVMERVSKREMEKCLKRLEASMAK